MRTGIIFGGRSDEHEISILSAASVLSAIDRERYEPEAFAIDKQGLWYHIEGGLDGLSELSDPRIPALFKGARRVSLSDFDDMTDFAFPLLHGPYGEDGTIQGLFEMLGKPYAGCGVASSAISMDKVFTKEIWARAGLPACAYASIMKADFEKDAAGETARIESRLPYPIFVKPANMGSSVGITMAHDRAGLTAAIGNAFLYDKRVIAEEYIRGRELEIGVLGGREPGVSVVGEIFPDAIYYDYDSKYRSDGTRLEIPADLPAAVREEIEVLALKAYQSLDGDGFARIDMFFDEERGKVYLSEMNAIPGFTKYSMFPLLWQAKGIGYTELIERIIELGYERHNTAHHRQPTQRT